MRLAWLAAVTATVVTAALPACKVDAPAPVKSQVTDDFERAELGTDYFASGPGYALVRGVLSAHGAHNHPLWFRRPLPRNVRVELDTWSTETRGDLKIEIFGDGHSFDPDGGRYTATGYEVIMGGWYNAKSIIARLDEHGSELAQRALPKVIPNQHYHWRIERQNAVLKWFVDDMTTPFLQYDDPHPLEGSGHEYLALNNWETDTWFDNLVITPL